jgi:hypothetical protein
MAGILLGESTSRFGHGSAQTCGQNQLRMIVGGGVGQHFLDFSVNDVNFTV